MSKTLVVRNGTLIDGSGRPSSRNEAIVIEGNRIKSVGALPPDVALEDRRSVEVIEAGGQWIMPGLIDAHSHVSYGYPVIKGEGKGRGTTRPEFSTLKSARNVQKVLRSGVTSISVPGGTWFTDVGVRDAIKLGLMEGPRMYVAGRMIVTYGCIEDDEPSWEGTPDHSIGKLCNTADEMVTEVRRQSKHGVNFIKMADSRSGESQMLAKYEIAAVVGGAHRRNPRVGIHSRGAGSTRAAAEAGVDWIIHADLATERDLEAVAKGGMPIIPTATFLAVVVELGQTVKAEQVQLDINRMKRHFDLLCELMHKARKLGIKLLVGTDTGNNSFTPYGELHAKELEILPMEAIVAATRDNAYAVGLEGQVRELAPDGEHDVVIAGENAVGLVKPAPANILAAPHQYPGMHRAGALELFFSGRLRGPQIAADIGSRQTETSHAGDHDMGEVLADTPAQRERHGRRGRGRSCADFVNEVSLDPSHQIDGGVEDRTPCRKAVGGIGANLWIERDLAAREQVMRGRVGREIGGGERRLANRLPRGVASGATSRL